MSIKVEPSKMIKKYASSTKVKRLISSKGVRLDKTALSFIEDIPFIEKDKIEDVALKVIKDYKDRVKKEAVKKTALKKDPKLLIQRVQNEVILNLSDTIREKYRGEKYRWLPSDAEEPDPEHQLLYGEIRTIGVGEMPGQRYGCQCGMEILVDESNIDL